MKTRTRVQQSATLAALVLAVLVVAAVAIQSFLAGLALFDRATWWADHRTFGMMIGPAVILLVLTMLLARPSRRLVGMNLASSCSTSSRSTCPRPAPAGSRRSTRSLGAASWRSR